jgi:uncharacterized membrane protein YjgN (DUF898 family)
VWSHIEVRGEPFIYLGTGAELFKSAVKFVVLLFFPAFILGLVSGIISHGKNDNFGSSINFLFVVLIFILIFVAKFMGLRYRMGRTSWRGIRFELRGRARDYLVLRLKNFVLNVLSLGLYCPLGDVEVLKFVINKSYFGTLPFRYRGQKEELQKTFYLCWLLFLPTLGFSIFWYKAKYIAHVAKYTTLGPMQFRIKFTGWEYCRLHVANMLLIIFSMGLAYPYVVHRRTRIYLQHTRFRGMIDEETIAQAQRSRGSEGAELSLGFDDFGF